jgi:acetyl-CoA carboxylase biotin carboxyl carrier protein
MTIKADEIISILKLARDSSCEELQIEIGDFKLVFRQAGPSPAEGVPERDRPETPSSTSNVQFLRGEREPRPLSDGLDSKMPDSGITEVKAPMVGIFFRSPSPVALPFIDVGTGVKEETTLCIIEVMKVMNLIKAGCRGRVAHIAVGDGDMVKFRQLLMTIEPE